MVRGRAVCLALAALANFSGHPAEAGSWPACVAGISSASHEAIGARDGATLKLAGGGEVKLAGIVAANELDGDASAIQEASAALDRLVAGKRILVYAAREGADRYGRILAQVALADSEAGWIQGLLVAGGMARVDPERAEPACTEALILKEKAARAAHAGIWSNPRFSVESTDNLPALNAAIGRFAVVEGAVVRVGETTSRTYIDFGRRYRESFTIVIPRAARASFRAAGIDLAALRGKRIRGRGVLFSSGGPAIEIRKPEAIEVIQGNGA